MGIRNNTLPSPDNVELELDEKGRQFLVDWAKGHHNFLEVLTDAYCIVDTHNRIVDFNVAFTDLCGESYRKVLRIADFCKILRTETCPHDCPSLQAIRENKTIRLDEIRATSRSSPDLQLIISATPIAQPDGKTSGALIVLRNVSAESELQKKYDERKKESVIDGLTQLYNKRYTETILLRFLKTSLRDKRPFTVLMCDIDHFKQVNDKYGHQAGDHVLTTVAQILKGESRDSDIVGRFGGE